MSIKSEWELIGTNRKSNCSGEQWKLSYSDRSYSIATSTRNSISDRASDIKDMSIKSEWKLIGTKKKNNGGEGKWKLSYSDRSYSIATSTRNSIGDGSSDIKDMSIKSEWELIGTNRKSNCSGEQWKLSYSDRSYSIATSTRNSISDRASDIKDMSIKSEWKLIGT